MIPLSSFLRTVGVLSTLDTADLDDLARAATERRFAAGERVLAQGERSSTLYFLRSGQVAVSVRRGRERTVVARFLPPAVFGELSFLTGRTCSADVDVLVDADVVSLPASALADRPRLRAHIVQGLTTVVAERLHASTSGAPAAPSVPIVCVRPSPDWAAPRAAARALATALAAEVAGDVLEVRWAGAAGGVNDTPARVANRTWQVTIPSAGDRRTRLAAALPAWLARFGAIVLCPDAADADVEGLSALATADVRLLGPGAEEPSASERNFVVRDVRADRAGALSGRRQVARDVPAAEAALRASVALPATFERTLASMARAVTGTQVGLALGSGGAWGWAHAGVIEVLERAGVPLDVVSGCSMGTAVGGVYVATGDRACLLEMADQWKRASYRLLEYRVWRLHLASERRVANFFRRFAGDERLERARVPFWANALDVQTGREVVIRDGTLVDAVRASMAFPGWMPPVQRGPHLLVDAAVMDPVPASLCVDMGAAFTVAVNAFAAVDAGPLPKRFPMQALELVNRCLRIASHQIGQLRGEASADVVIAPELGDTTMLSFGRGRELIDAGRRAAEQQLPLIQERLAELRRRLNGSRADDRSR